MVWCVKIVNVATRAAVHPPELEVGLGPGVSGRAMHRPQIILDLCPQGLCKETDTRKWGIYSEIRIDAHLVPVKF